MNENKLKVVHSIPVWLLQTMTWLHTQVRNLPDQVEAHIVCERTENLAQFNLPRLSSLREQSVLRYLLEKGLKKIGIVKHLPFIRHQLEIIAPTIVHSHFGDNGWRELMLLKRLEIPQIVTFYGWDVNYLPQHDQRWQNRYQQLFANVKRVLCEGKFMAAAIAKLGCPEEKTSIQHLGIDLEQLEFKVRHWQAGEPLKVLLVASFQEKKGLPYALEALGKIKRELPLKITLIGDTNNEPRSLMEKERILSTIERCGLEVNLLGYLPHQAVMQAAYDHHLFLSPSVTADDGDTEGGAPVVLIEMAASGLPVISTDHCDIPGVIEHDNSGYLSQERDVDGIVDNVYRLLDSTDNWSRIACNARRHIEQEFDAKVQGGKLAQIYTSVANSL